MSPEDERLWRLITNIQNSLDEKECPLFLLKLAKISGNTTKATAEQRIEALRQIGKWI